MLSSMGRFACAVSLLYFLASEGASYQPGQVRFHYPRSEYHPFFRLPSFTSKDCGERCGVVLQPKVSEEPPEDLKHILEVMLEENEIGKRTTGDSAYESVLDFTAPVPVMPWTTLHTGTATGVGATTSLRSLYETKNPNCTCRAKAKQSLDMGPQKFPRYLDTFGCDNDSCAPSYSCKEITFKTWILRLKRKSERHDKHVPLLPEPLRDDFTFEPIEIAAGCECFQQCDLV